MKTRSISRDGAVSDAAAAALKKDAARTSVGSVIRDVASVDGQRLEPSTKNGGDRFAIDAAFFIGVIVDDDAVADSERAGGGKWRR